MPGERGSAPTVEQPHVPTRVRLLQLPIQLARADAALHATADALAIARRATHDRTQLRVACAVEERIRRRLLALAAEVLAIRSEDAREPLARRRIAVVVAVSPADLQEVRMRVA